jgi:hypothetical protein
MHRTGASLGRMNAPPGGRHLAAWFATISNRNG